VVKLLGDWIKISVPSMMPTAFGNKLYGGSVGPNVVCGHLINLFN